MFELTSQEKSLQESKMIVVAACRSKLKVEDLKEAHLVMKDAQWAPDKEVTNCRQCNKIFSVSRRKVSLLSFVLLKVTFLVRRCLNVV
jgi:hypothetical protein